MNHEEEGFVCSWNLENKVKVDFLAMDSDPLVTWVLETFMARLKTNK